MKIRIKAANIQLCFRTALCKVLISHALPWRNGSAQLVVRYIPQILPFCVNWNSLSASSYSNCIATALQYILATVSLSIKLTTSKNTLQFFAFKYPSVYMCYQFKYPSVYMFYQSTLRLSNNPHFVSSPFKVTNFTAYCHSPFPKHPDWLWDLPRLLSNGYSPCDRVSHPRWLESSWKNMQASARTTCIYC